MRIPAPKVILPGSVVCVGAAGRRMPAPMTILPESATWEDMDGGLLWDDRLIVKVL